jgi:hypothetical protein
MPSLADGVYKTQAVMDHAPGRPPRLPRARASRQRASPIGPGEMPIGTWPKFPVGPKVPRYLPHRNATRRHAWRLRALGGKFACETRIAVVALTNSDADHLSMIPPVVLSNKRGPRKLPLRRVHLSTSAGPPTPIEAHRETSWPFLALPETRQLEKSLAGGGNG